MSTKRSHHIVQPEFESPMHESLEADALEQLLKSVQGNPFLVLAAFHFIAHQTQLVKYAQNRVDHCRRPGHDQRPAGRDHSEGLDEHALWVLEVLKNRQHHNVIKLTVCKWQ